VPVPPPTDYAPYYGRYVSLVPEADILPVLVSEAARTAEFLGRIPPAEEVVCHAPYTWTIRQVIGHLTDAERVFAYRALWFARGGAGPLPGFDDAQFATNAPHARVPLADQADEYRHLRAANVHLLGQLDEIAWERRGVASETEITVRALAYCLVGHERHHMTIVRKRLGSG
jgi:DinB superfamily